MANIQIGLDFSGVKEEIKRIATDKIKAAAQKIADELTLYAKSTILDFYVGYDPVKYKRQHGLFDTGDRYYKNAHGNIYYGGVELHPGSGSYSGWSGGHRVGISADWPSALAIFSGRHGYVEAFPHTISNIPPKMSPPPFDLIQKRRDEIVANINSYVN